MSSIGSQFGYTTISHIWYYTISHIWYYTDLAESDGIYTRTLTGSGRHDMNNSNILILGIVTSVVMVIYNDHVMLQGVGMEQH